MFVFSLFAIICFAACGGQQNYIWDYYRKYKFVIPFEYNVSWYVGYLAIRSDLSFSQIQDELSKTYIVTKHRTWFDSNYRYVDCLFVSTTKNEEHYYFFV